MKVDVEFMRGLAEGVKPRVEGVEREILDMLLASQCIQDSVRTVMIATLVGDPMRELATAFCAMWSMGFQMGRAVEQTEQLESLAAAGE